MQTKPDSNILHTTANTCTCTCTFTPTCIHTYTKTKQNYDIIHATSNINIAFSPAVQQSRSNSITTIPHPTAPYTTTTHNHHTTPHHTIP
ncbi:hypothetical protein DENSPDRAFT_688615 [Dentipellis sp. KUC8613]|nr:hypothetical protein DENSPDRAFT_688615 [Dentipellis sp. KUC8613]